MQPPDDGIDPLFIYWAMARKFNWTPRQVDELTLDEIVVLLSDQPPRRACSTSAKPIDSEGIRRLREARKARRGR